MTEMIDMNIIVSVTTAGAHNPLSRQEMLHKKGYIAYLKECKVVQSWVKQSSNRIAMD